MTEINGDRQRARRRAVRSVGPPVEETASPEVVSVPAATAGAARATNATAASFAARAAAAVQSSAEKASAAGTSAGDTVAEAAKGEVSADASVDLGKPADADKSVDLGKSVDPAVDQASADADQPKKRRTGRIVAVAAAAVLVLTLVVGAGWSMYERHSIDARDARRAECVQTARQAVLNLTTIRADSAREDIDRILKLASGEFKGEFNQRVDPFINIVQQAKVVSTGEIIEAALEGDVEASDTVRESLAKATKTDKDSITVKDGSADVDKNSVKVLVAAKQTLTNAGQEGPQTRLYRFRVTISDGPSGLTASKVEFVA